MTMLTPQQWRARLDTCEMKANELLVKELLQAMGVGKENDVAVEALRVLYDNEIITWGNLLHSDKDQIPANTPSRATIWSEVQDYKTRKAAAVAGEC